MSDYSNLFKFLRPLAQKEEEYDPKKRVVLAELRRGLTDLPRLSPHLHQHLQPILPEKAGWWEKRTYYLIASLFALHPKFYEGENQYANIGDHFAAVRRPEARNKSASDDKEMEDTALERRFSLLLTAHPEDLYYHLRQAVSYLKAKGEGSIHINWYQLTRDVDRWNNDKWRARVQEKWAERFWRRKKSDSADDETNNAAE